MEIKIICVNQHAWMRVKMKINPLIFREYDIRGVVDRDLTPEIVRRLGQGFGTYVAPRGLKKLVVGRDGRLSSKTFGEALMEGLLSTGCDVVDIGLCPTPVYYFSLFHLDQEGGMMVTGSHNPPEFNGFKISVGKSTLFGEEIQKLGRLVGKTPISLRGKDIFPRKRSFLPTRITLRRMSISIEN